MIIVMTTIDSEEKADVLARSVVEARLAGCVQVLPPMRSCDFWEGEVRRDTEHLLLIKTLEQKYSELEAHIIANHSYEVPEVLALRAESVSSAYASWLSDYLFARLG